VKRRESISLSHRRLLAAAGITAGILMSLASLSATSGDDQVAFPEKYSDWQLVNSTIVTKDSPLFEQLGGMHLIYANATGLPTLKEGGPFPYPDGTIFADNVHHFSVEDGRYLEATRKAVTVMAKDSKKYALTGGWGFQVWAEGDPSKPLVPDAAHAVQACFACHSSQKAHDYIFSAYKP
jgi:hypothetical protein